MTAEATHTPRRTDWLYFSSGASFAGLAALWIFANIGPIWPSFLNIISFLPLILIVSLPVSIVLAFAALFLSRPMSREFVFSAVYLIFMVAVAITQVAQLHS